MSWRSRRCGGGQSSFWWRCCAVRVPPAMFANRPMNGWESTGIFRIMCWRAVTRGIQQRADTTNTKAVGANLSSDGTSRRSNHATSPAQSDPRLRLEKITVSPSADQAISPLILSGSCPGRRLGASMPSGSSRYNCLHLSSGPWMDTTTRSRLPSQATMGRTFLYFPFYYF